MDYILADEKIIFLYKLKDGRSEQSFGINVAKVVKIPPPIIEMAREIHNDVKVNSQEGQNKKIERSFRLCSKVIVVEIVAIDIINLYIFTVYF